MRNWNSWMQSKGFKGACFFSCLQLWRKFWAFHGLLVALLLLLPWGGPENKLNAALSGSEEIKSSVSTFNFVIHYPIYSLKRSLNSNFQGLVFSDTSFSDNGMDNTKVRAWRQGTIEVTAINNKMYVQVPLLIEVELRIDRVFRYEIASAKLEFPVQGTKKFSFRVIAVFQIEADFNEDLQFKAQTQAAFKWLSYPYIDFYRIFKFRVDGEVGEKIQNQLNTFAERINANIETNVRIENFMQPLNKFIEEPIALDADKELWLNFQAQQAKIAPLKIANRSIHINVSLKAQLGLAFNSAGERFLLLERQKASLISGFSVNHFSRPKLTAAEDVQASGFFTDFLVNISSDSLQELFLQHIVSEPISFDKGNINIQVDEVYLKNQENKLLADVYMTARIVRGTFGGRKFKIRMLLSANPYFDSKEKAIRLRNIEYEFNSDSGLLKIWSLARKDEIRSAIVESIYVSADDILARLNTEIDAALNDKKLSNQALLKLQNYSLLIKSVFMRDNQLTVFFSASGNFFIELLNLF